ncbi:MAG TPA: hypothetical protein DEV72_08965 [Ktedonobacter sp.]|nr:hypothetical protein [Ktedonobacter sp.]
MRRQGRGFPEAVSSIVSSHHPASRVRISLTLTDNWKCCIIFSSPPAFVPPYYGHILGRHTSLTSIIAEVVGMAPVEECEHEMFVLIRRKKRQLAVPLMQLEGIQVEEKTQQAIEDWHYWVNRGYEL